MPHPAFAAAAAFCAFWLAWWSNRSIVGWLPDDPPGAARKQHGRPIPLAGVVLPFAAAPWLARGHAAVACAILVASAVGFVDDRGKERGHDLDWRWKALGLGAAAALGATAAVSPIDEPLGWAAAALLVFVLTNATNFLDNTNGVAASLAAVSLLLLANGDAAIAAFGWAALGFLPWNWPKARLFLGDSGAYALGTAVGIAAARGAASDATRLLAVAVQLLDFVQVLTARLALALPPWVGDRRHLTHIAQNLGMPAHAVAPFFAVLALLLGALACCPP
ncbi:MAG: hypothetical protein JNK78_06305 [Planctomycetes bacterium]|nr:hypothetical protein [Planctomycetota bacterium]